VQHSLQHYGGTTVQPPDPALGSSRYATTAPGSDYRHYGGTTFNVLIKRESTTVRGNNAYLTPIYFIILRYSAHNYPINALVDGVLYGAPEWECTMVREVH
jgi:hypothetical protein